MTDRFQFGVVILAAGASSRMGRPKMLLPWGETTVLGRVIEQWRDVGAALIAVVTADGDASLAAELDRLRVVEADRIINRDPSRGMFSSIQCAAQWKHWSDALVQIAIVLGDQPHLAIETLRAVARFAGAHPREICQPSHRGRARHPVFLPTRLFESIATTSAGTLKEFLALHASLARFIELNDPGLDLDLDTPGDYERVRAQFLESGRGGAA